MKVTVCLGSDCHKKGARHVVEELQYLIAEGGYSDKVELAGTFCLGNCQRDVCVSLDGAVHSVKPEDVRSFFAEEIVAKLAK